MARTTAADDQIDLTLASDSDEDPREELIINATAPRLRPVRPQDAWAQNQLAGRSAEPIVLPEYIAPRANVAHQISLSGSAAATMTAMTAGVATMTAATSSHDHALHMEDDRSGRSDGGRSSKGRSGRAVAHSICVPPPCEHEEDVPCGKQHDGATGSAPTMEALGTPPTVRRSEGLNEASSPAVSCARLDVDREEMPGAPARDPLARRGGKGVMGEAEASRMEVDVAEAGQGVLQPRSRSPGIAARTRQRRRGAAAATAAAPAPAAVVGGDATVDDDDAATDVLPELPRRRPPPSALAQAWARLPVPPRAAASPSCMWLLGFHFDPELTRYYRLAARPAFLERLGDAVDRPCSEGPDGVHLLTLVQEPTTMHYWGSGGGRTPTEM